MAEKVLLLLGIADAEEAGIYIKKESHRRDVRVKGEGRQHEENAVEEAFNYARSKSKSVVAVQVLTPTCTIMDILTSFSRDPGKNVSYSTSGMRC